MNKCVTIKKEKSVQSKNLCTQADFSFFIDNSSNYLFHIPDNPKRINRRKSTQVEVGGVEVVRKYALGKITPGQAKTT